MRQVGHGVDYSTFNPRTLQWDYWRAMGDPRLRSGVIAPAPRLSRPQLGVAPEEAARRLPPDVKKIGSGDVARGQVATQRALGSADDLRNWAIYGAVAYLLYRYVWRAR